MSFLSCAPSVFVVNNYYEIHINTTKKGICGILVNGKKFYEENAGLLFSEKKSHKIQISQQELDSAKKYDVIFRGSKLKQAYFSQFDEQEIIQFAFKPLVKTENINIYHIADIHKQYKLALKCCDFFKSELDLLIINGDITELETKKDYLDISRFVGAAAKGEIPVIFTRGNHDTRGKLAEQFTQFSPAYNSKTYYQFSVGILSGVVLDCGEDKADSALVYGGANNFEQYRKQELQFLEQVELQDDKIRFSICHICPTQTTFEPANCFDIERDVYSQWNAQLERMKIQFMLCGHEHRALILKSDDEKNLLPHNYPVIIGSQCEENNLWGTALILSKNKLSVMFTDSHQTVKQQHDLQLKAE